uniref:Vinorine hydroxylase n=1 Tax=Rauvolfia serpentina TaxID=4060 RepID=VINHY_RAUSE|nr:vinorine hydroxylase [Rauvolfia serpentina]
MDLLQILLAIAGLLAILLLQKQWRTKTSPGAKAGRKLPPEPAGAWPVIGHLHKLGGPNPIYRNLAEWSDKYGPVMTLKLGMQNAVVVSDREAIKECFTTNDKALADRPPSSIGLHLGFNYAAIGAAPYGPYWRDMRKLVLLEVLSSRRLEMLRNVRISEIGTSIKELYSNIIRSSGGSGPAKVVISHWIEQLTLNYILRTIAGRRFSDDSSKDAQYVKGVINDFMYFAGQFVVSDVIPIPLLRWLDPQGHLKGMKRVAKEVDTMCEAWIQEHVQRRMREKPGPGQEQDFIDVLLNNRDVMRKAQEEIDNHVGKERWVDETDLKHLVYLQAIVKEGLRLYPPGPLGAPHRAIEDCQVGGYFIPKGTQLLVNVWKLHRDPRVWSEPEKFMPERFLTRQAEVDVFGHHFELLPFGSGRRACPGITFAVQVMHLTVARLLQGFDMTTPSNLPVDMTEGPGVTMPKAHPVEVLMMPRLPSALYEP